MRYVKVMSKLLASIAILFLVLVVAVNVIVYLDGRMGRAMPEASSVGSLRAIHTAEITYSATYKRGFSKTLVALGSPDDGPCQSPSMEQACLIDAVLAEGTKGGYVYTYTPDPPDNNGRIADYTVIARPQTSRDRNRSFYFDSTGIIRFTKQDRAATKQDAPLQ